MPSPIRAARSAAAPFRSRKAIGAKIIEEADVEDLKSVEHVFDVIKKKWGSLDFVVHALAFSDRNELRGTLLPTPRARISSTPW